MKYFCFLIFLNMLAVHVFSQHFEGEIVYQNTYQCRIPGVTDEKFTALMGTEQDYFIKESSYKSILNGTLAQWQLYIPSVNRLYTKMSNSDTAFWDDAGVNPDSVISIIMNKSVRDILGYRCDELILNCKSGTQKFYFNSALGIDPKKFNQHKYGNWIDYVSQAKAVPLMMIIENQQFVMTSEAVKIKSAKLENTVFQLPAGIITEKSAY